MTRLLLALVTSTACWMGCGGKATPKTAQTPPRPAATATTTTTTPVTPTLGVTDDLAKSCLLRIASTQEAPRFDYDGDELAPADREVLEQVAVCLTSGPLKGRTVRLVGRADPRGTSEYNLGLGTRRATTVNAYLQRLGVGPQQLAATTRGDLDAAGQDEDGWRTDRRVDLELAN